MCLTGHILNLDPAYLPEPLVWIYAITATRYLSSSVSDLAFPDAIDTRPHGLHRYPVYLQSPLY